MAELLPTPLLGRGASTRGFWPQRQQLSPWRLCLRLRRPRRLPLTTFRSSSVSSRVRGYYLSPPLPIDRIREWSSSFQLLPGHDLPHSEQADIVPIGVRSLSN
jgi:hypothetical protein